MRRRTLASDVDEVLADFQTPALQIMEKVTGRAYRPEDFVVWDIFSVLSEDEKREVFAEIERPGWCAALQPTEGAIEAVAELRTIVDVFPVTSPFHSPTWMYERTYWLGKHFGWKPGEVVHTGSKQVVLADGLLDDKPNHVVDWGNKHPGGLAMLKHIPNTRMMHEMDDRRVYTWAEVIEKAKTFASRKDVYELLKEREFTYVSLGSDAEARTCEECGARTTGDYLHPAKAPKHKPGCRLDEVLRGMK
jgi:5'(3')-deoxyribonucleotidase